MEGNRILLCVKRMVFVALDFTRIAEMETKARSSFRCLAERKL